MQFGNIDIDSRLIQAKEVVEGVEIVESLNGCACCTVRGDLMEALIKLVNSEPLTFSTILCSLGWQQTQNLPVSKYSKKKHSLSSSSLCPSDTAITQDLTVLKKRIAKDVAAKTRGGKLELEHHILWVTVQDRLCFAC